MVKEYIRNLTMDVNDGEDNFTDFPNLYEVEATYRNKFAHPEVEEVISKEGRVIVIEKKGIWIYREG